MFPEGGLKVGAAVLSGDILPTGFAAEDSGSHFLETSWLDDDFNQPLGAD